MIEDTPTDWEVERLGNLVDILDSQRVPVNREERSKRSGDIPYYGATGQVGWIDKPLFNEELLLLGEDGVQFLDHRKPKAYMISGPSWVNNHAHVLRAVRGKTTNRYLQHYLNVFDYHGFVTGTTRLKLNQRAMREIPVVLAPLDEQHRIVEAIETHLSHLDAGVESLQRAKRNIEVMRAAVLRAAVEGRLISPRADDGSAMDWLTHVKKWRLTAGRSPRSGYGPVPEVPDHWAVASIDEIAITASGGTPSRSRPEYYGGDIPWVKSGELGDGLVTECGETITELGLKKSSARLFDEGTLMIALYGATVGRLGVLAMPSAATNQAVCGIRTKGPDTTRWLFLVLMSMRTTLIARGKGGAQSNISQEIVRSTVVPIPPPGEQVRIVQEVDRQLSLIAALSEAVDLSQRRTSRLRQAILQAAFSGKLPSVGNAAA